MFPTSAKTLIHLISIFIIIIIACGLYLRRNDLEYV